MAKRYFYVDSIGGNDANNGTSGEKAWKTIDKVNAQVFMPGDVIRFKKGGEWHGMLEPKGNGAAFNPIVIESYGDADCDKMPVIHGDGSYAAIYLNGVSHWIVRGIKVTNHAEERAVRQGIAICGAPLGITEDITVEGCEVTDVTGENRRSQGTYKCMYWNGGIYVTSPTRTSKQNHLHNIIIQKNYIHDVLTSGVRVNQEEDFLIDINHTHVVVRGNRIERTGSDAIIVANCISPLISGNTCIDAGALGNEDETLLIAGVWVCATENALIERNEVAGTRLFKNDGTAFDTDWGTAGDTIFQYNYSHGNFGGFWLDCMGINRNKECGKTILRYNISVNDKRCLIQDDYGIPGELYGNLFVNTEEGPIVCCHRDGESHLFSENIFWFADQPKEGWQKSWFDKNWYGNLKDLPESDSDPRPGTPFPIDSLLSKVPESMEECREYWDKLPKIVELTKNK